MANFGWTFMEALGAAAVWRMDDRSGGRRFVCVACCSDVGHGDRECTKINGEAVLMRSSAAAAASVRLASRARFPLHALRQQPARCLRVRSA